MIIKLWIYYYCSGFVNNSILIADLATVIRQMTKGMGWFTMEFARYEQLPANIEADVIANAPKYKSDDDE